MPALHILYDDFMSQAGRQDRSFEAALGGLLHKNATKRKTTNGVCGESPTPPSWPCKMCSQSGLSSSQMLFNPFPDSSATIPVIQLTLSLVRTTTLMTLHGLDPLCVYHLRTPS